jgi:trans-AT polyketide synthase, acyltransferase and oxidoreductase domains
VAHSIDVSNLLGSREAVGHWVTGRTGVAFDAIAIASAAERFREQVHVVGDIDDGRVGVAFDGGLARASVYGRRGGRVLLASLPPVQPEWLGCRAFLSAHRVRFPYVAGEMAHGIATAELVISIARAGMLGFFGAGGLSLDRIEVALVAIARQLGTGPEAPSWGANLIHMPHDPTHEERVVDLYLRHHVTRVSASAFMRVTPAVVRMACRGLRREPSGNIARRHHLFAKVSRPEVARAFMAPPEPSILTELVARGALTAAEAELAAQLPLAEDITVEADSGGHTDNRPLTALMPQMLALREQAKALHGRAIRVGAAGGLGTPGAVAAAFALGASYVLTGSINQVTVESGMSASGKEMLAAATPVDVVMAPSPDMFELGVKVQVLRRGTLFAGRAARLYEIYQRYGGLDELPGELRERVEREIFRKPLAAVWEETARYWRSRNPAEMTRAERDPRHQMALCFRWYIGQSALWAIEGVADRRADYQLWCGPAMGAFNEWVRGSFLEELAARDVVQVALNLLEGAAAVTRAQQLRSVGLAVPSQAFTFIPRPLSAGAPAPGAHLVAS